MSTTVGGFRPASAASNWRTPLVVIVCGCAIAMLGFGPRSSVGFFIRPMGEEYAWGRDVFGLALAVQNLLWGLGQPLAGAIADRFGLTRVMIIGALLYAGGLLLMRYATTPLSLNLGAGVLVISQFTLYGDARKGRRPTWTAAAPGPVSEPLYDALCAELERSGTHVERGVFGAHMSVDLVNDGPVTMVLETPPASSR